MIYERIPLSETDARVFIDAYAADSPDKRDAMLVIPGGGYGCVCDDREGEPIALAFLARGLNCFVLHYTVAPDGAFPIQLIEASKAMKHIRLNAARYHINPDRVFTVGFSAGGHLAASLGTLWHLPAVTAAIGDDSGINRPTGMLLCYAVLTAFDYSHEGSFFNLLGTKTPTKEQLEAVSLERHVDSRSSPAFLMHTANDGGVPVENALLMAGALSAAKLPFELHIYPDAPHGVALADKVTEFGNPAWTDSAIAKWVDHAVYWMGKLK